MMTSKRTLDDALDAAMADDALIPSSGFVDTVMSAVRASAATPEAIAFPWARVWPAAMLAGAAAAAPLAVATTTGRIAPGIAGSDAFAHALADVSAALARVATHPDVQIAAGAIALTALLIAVPGRLLTSR
jgi:hypothetical protein